MTHEKVAWAGRRGIGLALCLVAVSFTGGCRPNGEPAETGSADAGPMLVGPESTARAEQTQLETGPRIAGTLEAEQQARVRAEVSGAVTEVNVELGESVKKGRLLGRIEDRALRDALSSAQSSLAAAEGDLQLAERQVQRTRRLVEAGALAQTNLETAESQAVTARARLDQARAQMAQTQKQVGSTTLEAPISGVVSERAVNEGDVVAPGAPLFTIIDPSSLRLSAQVPSDALSALQVGKPVQFTVRGLGDHRFAGKIERIAPAADPVTRQITVLVSIPNPGGRLLSGLFAEGRIAAETRNALVVPEAAVEEAAGEAWVSRVKDGKVERVEVKLGLRDEQSERVQVEGGLQEGDVVLTGAARSLTPGTPVQVQVPTQPQPQPPQNGADKPAAP